MATVRDMSVLGESLHSEQRLHDLIHQVQPPNCTTTPLDDDFFDQVSAELKALGLQEPWYSRPRTYFILSKIKNVGMMTAFILQGCDDTSIPYPSQSALPQSELKHWNPFQVQDFMRWQRVCESERLQLEKGAHCRLDDGNVLFREHGQRLGEGSEMNTTVDRVVSKFTGEVYARKRIARKRFPRQAQIAFQREIRALTKIAEHEHLIRVCGTYTDKKYFALLLQPVADCTLKEYLVSSRCRTTAEKKSLWAYFGCMANVMIVLHDQEKILHKDIKADNFLLYQGRLILTDFGTAFDFSQTDQSMTLTNRDDARTIRYSSPEVVLEGRFHRASDIWSLGIVYLEILTILCDKTLKDFDVHMTGTHRFSREVYTNQPAALDWLRKLQSNNPNEANSAPFKAIPQMLKMTVDGRPLARQLYADLWSSQGGRFCGECCRPQEADSEPESDSDLLQSDEDEHTVLPKYQQYVQTVVDESDTCIPGSFPMEVQTDKTHEPSFNKTASASISSYGAMQISNVQYSLPHGQTAANARSETIVASGTSETAALPEPSRRSHEPADPSRAEDSSPGFGFDESAKGQNTSARSKARIAQTVAKKLVYSFLPAHSDPQPKSLRDSRPSRLRRSSTSPATISRRRRLSSGGHTHTTPITLTVQDQLLEHYLTSLPAGDDYDSIEEDSNKYPPSPDLKRRLQLIDQVPTKAKIEADLPSTTETPEYQYEPSSDLITPSMLFRFPSDGHLRERYSTQEESRTQIDAELKGFQHLIVLPSPGQTELQISPTSEVQPDFFEDDNGNSASPEVVVDLHETDAQEAALGNSFARAVEPEPVPVPDSFPEKRNVAVAENTPSPAIAEGPAAQAADPAGITQTVTTTNTTPDVASRSLEEGQATVPHDVNPPEYRASSATPSMPLRVPPVSVRQIPRSSDGSSAVMPLATFLDAVPLPKKSTDKWESISVYMKRILDDKASVAATSVMSVNTRKLLSAPGLKWNDKYYGYLPHFVAKGKVAAIRKLLSCGCNPGTHDKPRWWPMLNAVKGRTDKHTKCLIALIEHGADTRASDSTGKTYLHHAISQEPWQGYSTTVYVLLMNNANPNAVDDRGYTPLLSLLVGKGRPKKDPIAPLRQEERDALMVLLAPNFRTNISRSLPAMNENVLHLAIMRRDPYVVDALLEKVDDATKGLLVHEVDRDGYTPLILVLKMCTFSTPDAAETATRMLELLLQNGASPNDNDPETGDTALHIVLAEHKTMEAFKLLVNHDADPTVKNAKNVSAARLLHSLVDIEQTHWFHARAKELVSRLEKWQVPIVQV